MAIGLPLSCLLTGKSPFKIRITVKVYLSANKSRWPSAAFGRAGLGPRWRGASRAISVLADGPMAFFCSRKSGTGQPSRSDGAIE